MKPQPAPHARYNQPIISDPQLRFAVELKRAANQGFILVPDGEQHGRYLHSCAAYHEASQACISFVREINDDLPRFHRNEHLRHFWHLTISFAEIKGQQFNPLPIRPESAAEWAKAFFGRYRTVLLVEPPVRRSRARDIIHYRLFCTDQWQPVTPPNGRIIVERPKRWRTWKQAHGDM